MHEGHGGLTPASNTVLLTIAGFDPSSGAGVTADLLTFVAHDFFGCSALTALTVQSTMGVRRVHPLPGELLRDTLDELERDVTVVGVKIGMLAGVETAKAVVAYLRSARRKRKLVVVLDPVLRSSSGAALLESSALSLLREELLPLCDVVTPNAAELSGLLGSEGGDLLQSALEVSRRYPQLSVIVTGGESKAPDDLLVRPGREPLWIKGERVETTSTHGTGCAYSSALLCRLVMGNDLERAARQAKAFVEGALRAAPKVGHGRGPMNLMWPRTPKNFES